MPPTIRSLTTTDDYRACVELQRETWGAHFADCVPPAVLQISQKVGGVVAGAFDPPGHLVGIVYSIAGWREGEQCHWSHMLAVREQCRDRGIGKALKDFQREELLRQGIRVMYWTYDPLVARNARLNIRKLGVEVVEYVRDMYGVDEASVTDSVIGSDRFVVKWNLEAPDDNSGATAGTEGDASSTPLVVAAVDASGETTQIEEPLQHPVVRVEIPTDIQALKLAMPEVARSWRATTRRVFETYLGNGYGVAGFYSEADSQRCFYYLVARGGR